MAGERTAWPPNGGGLLPGRIGAPADRPGRGGSLGFVDYGHPVFEVFGAPRSGDVTTARFFRFRPVEPAPGATVAARFDDGNPARVVPAEDLERRQSVWWYLLAAAALLSVAETLVSNRLSRTAPSTEPPPLSQPDGGSGTVM